MWIDKLKCLSFLLKLLDLSLFLSEHHFMCFLCLLLLSFDADALEELEILIALLELGVYALSHILQVSYYPDSFFHIARSLIFYSGELDVIVGNGDVA